MKDVYIAGAVRTAIGSFGGSLRWTPAHILAEKVLREAVHRANLTPDLIDEVIFGEVRNSEVSNIGRVALLAAGFPDTIPAYSVNRLCASSMQAFKSGFHAIATGDCDVVVVGGVENMSRAPVYLNGDRFGREPLSLVNAGTDGGRSSVPPEIYGRNLSMIQTAQNVADQYHISREDQDAFALASQHRYAAALEAGIFRQEILPIEVPQGKATRMFEEDESPRTSVTMEALQKLRPLIPGGSVTAGNSCARNDGASAMVLLSQEMVKRLGCKPMGRVASVASSGVPPELMGIGPITAVRKVLRNTGLTLDQIDLIELNEAFASQSLAVVRELGLDTAILNVNGGAIALGHPLGNTGTRLIVTLLHEMRRRASKRGLATLCVGGGQGMAAIVELV